MRPLEAGVGEGHGVHVGGSKRAALSDEPALNQRRERWQGVAAEAHIQSDDAHVRAGRTPRRANVQEKLPDAPREEARCVGQRHPRLRRGGEPGLQCRARCGASWPVKTP